MNTFASLLDRDTVKTLLPNEYAIPSLFAICGDDWGYAKKIFKIIKLLTHHKVNEAFDNVEPISRDTIPKILMVLLINCYYAIKRVEIQMQMIFLLLESVCYHATDDRAKVFQKIMTIRLLIKLLKGLKLVKWLRKKKLILIPSKKEKLKKESINYHLLIY